MLCNHDWIDLNHDKSGIELLLQTLDFKKCDQPTYPQNRFVQNPLTFLTFVSVVCFFYVCLVFQSVSFIVSTKVNLEDFNDFTYHLIFSRCSDLTTPNVRQSTICKTL